MKPLIINAVLGMTPFVLFSLISTAGLARSGPIAGSAQKPTDLHDGGEDQGCLSPYLDHCQLAQAVLKAEKDFVGTTVLVRTR